MRFRYIGSSSRPSRCMCSPSLHIGHSRSFAMDTDAMECSSEAPSAELIDAFGNVRSVSRSRLSLSISQATISIDWPVHGILSLLGDPREFSGGFRLSLMWEPQSSDCELMTVSSSLTWNNSRVSPSMSLLCRGQPETV